MPTKRRKEQQKPIRNITLDIKLQELGDNNRNDRTVQGTLDIESKSDTQIHGVLLTIHGDIWSEITSGSSSPSTSSNQKYSASIFVQSSYILGRGSGTMVLAKGKHSLPFTFCLPQQLPSSFEGVYGSIKYMITAQVHTDNERNDEANKLTQQIQVRRFLDLSDGLAYGNPVSYPSRMERPLRTLRSTLMPSQHLKFIFKVLKIGFASGEIIPFVLDVFNPERLKLAYMSVTLVKKTTYGDLKYNIDVFDEVAEVSTLTIDNHKSTLTWIGSLHVPQDVAPTHSVIASVPKKKTIFSHRYLLRVKLVPHSGACVIGDMPIVIGTTKYECRSRRQLDHCSRVMYSLPPRDIEQQPAVRRQSSMPPSYSQTLYQAERRASLETLPPPYEEAIAMASRTLAKETRHLMG